MVSSPRRCRRIQSFCHLSPSLACQIFQQRRQQQSPLSSASRVLRWPCPFLHGACEVLQDPPERQEGGDVTSTALWLWYPSSLVVSFFQFVVVNSLSQCGLVVRVACRVSRVTCRCWREKRKILIPRTPYATATATATAIVVVVVVVIVVVVAHISQVPLSIAFNFKQNMPFCLLITRLPDVH